MRACPHCACDRGTRLHVAIFASTASIRANPPLCALDAVLHRRIALLGRGEAHRLRQLWSAHRDPRTRESAGDSGTSTRGAGAARLRGTRPQPRRRQFGTGRCRDERPSPRRRCRQPSPVMRRAGRPQSGLGRHSPGSRLAPASASGRRRCPAVVVFARRRYRHVCKKSRPPANSRIVRGVNSDPLGRPKLLGDFQLPLRCTWLG
jgi:hypothetical protein